MLSEEKAENEEGKRKRVEECLYQANHCLDSLKDQLKQAKKNCQEKEHWWNIATKEKREMREALKT